MEVISSKSFEEDSSGESNVETNHNIINENKPKYYSNPYSAKNFNLESNEEINESKIQIELKNIKEINDLDDDDEEEVESKTYNNYEENNIRDNNTINSIDEESSENNINNLYSLHSPSKNSENKPIEFILFKDDKYIISNDAKNLFMKNKYKNICLISSIGKCSTGKSYLLNKILSLKKNNGFYINSDFKPCTKGIWIWPEPIIVKNKNSHEEYPCFFIDTQGLSKSEEKNKLIYLILLISSLVIFNSFEVGENLIEDLNFVLNINKQIKIKHSLKNDNEHDLIQFLPSLLIISKDFNYKEINEQNYFEKLLINKEQNIEEKSDIKELIKIYFPKRDFFTMIKPIYNNSVYNFKNLNDDQLNPLFIKQIRLLKHKIFTNSKPKNFNNNFITGNMLIELIQSILNQINIGGVAIIENSWKFILKEESNKYEEELIKKFNDEINVFKNKNNKNNDFIKNVNSMTQKITQKYLNKFLNNNILLKKENNINEYYEQFKMKLNNELLKFNKENEKSYKEKFIKELNLLSNKFIENLTSNNLYEGSNSYNYFKDFENLRQAAIKTTPDFPKKNEILFDKILLIMKKLINEKIIKIKVIEEEKNYLDNETKSKKQKIIALNNELNLIKNKNNEFLIKLKNDLLNENKKYKCIEEKMTALINNKAKEIENLKKNIDIESNNYENQIKEMNDIKNNIAKEIKIKEEQILSMKNNNDKISNLYEQKSQFLEKEINSWKEKCNSVTKENSGKKNSLSSLVTYVKNHLKDKNKFNLEKCKTNKNKEIYNDRDNETKNNNFEDDVINLNKQKDFINNIKDFKCKFCMNTFSFSEFKEHYNICDKNPCNNTISNIRKNYSENHKNIENENYKKSSNKSKNKNSSINKNVLKKFKTMNNNEINDINNSKDLIKNINNFQNKTNLNPKKLKIKIVKGRVRKDKSGKPYLEYVINITYNNNKNLNINRRFNEFTNLYKSLKGIRNIELPESSSIFNNISIFTGLSHEKKTLFLEKFLEDLINKDIINESKILYDFLELDKLLNQNESLFYFSGGKNEEIKNIRNFSHDKTANNFNKIFMINNIQGGLNSDVSTMIKSPGKSDINSNFVSNYTSNFNSNNTTRFEKIINDG